jgi:hypothetical protein
VPPEVRNGLPLNNNRNNNRRRGRGNRNQSGGGNQGNRIDSRARGNAPQLLDKYKKLAQDAQHNGDRVQAEYYLQFADHYFRVIADNRARQDEQRGDPRGDQRFGRRDEREQDDFDGEEDEGAEFGGEERRRYEPRERDERGGSRERDSRRDRSRREFRHDEPADDAGLIEASEGPAFDPEDNPFSRDAGSAGGDEAAERPSRRAPRARRSASPRGASAGSGGGEPGFDAAVLPPSFSAGDAEASQGEDAAPRRRRKRSDGGTLSAVV